MSKISLYTASALIIVSGVVGAMIGYALTPQYAGTMYDKNSMDLGTADRWVDLRYVNAMIAHHRGAMLVAEQAQKYSQRPEIQGLAADILKNEPVAIAELKAWKKAWYGDTREVKDPVVPNLGTYDEKFDLRFLNAVIAHHQNGLVMTREIRTKSSRTEVLNNADAVEAFLTQTGDVLKGWRKDWYNL